MVLAFTPRATAAAIFLGRLGECLTDEVGDGQYDGDVVDAKQARHGVADRIEHEVATVRRWLPVTVHHVPVDVAVRIDSTAVSRSRAAVPVRGSRPRVTVRSMIRWRSELGGMPVTVRTKVAVASGARPFVAVTV